jgi:hypothetical protein
MAALRLTTGNICEGPTQLADNQVGLTWAILNHRPLVENGNLPRLPKARRGSAFAWTWGLFTIEQTANRGVQ